MRELLDKIRSSGNEKNVLLVSIRRPGRDQTPAFFYFLEKNDVGVTDARCVAKDVLSRINVATDGELTFGPSANIDFPNCKEIA